MARENVVSEQNVELTDEQKKKNLAWWTQKISGNVWLSDGIKETLKNMSTPKPMRVKARDLAEAAKKCEVYYIPKDDICNCALADKSHWWEGPFCLKVSLGINASGEFFRRYMLVSSTESHCVLSERAVRDIADELGRRYRYGYNMKLPDSYSKIVELPIPKWITTTGAAKYYCYWQEKEIMIKDFIDSVMITKIK